MFSQLVASLRQKASTGGSDLTSRKRAIPFRPESRPVFSKHKARSLGKVPDVLGYAFRDLVAGIASWPLYLWGGPGTGKTCGVLALCDHVARPLYITTSDLTTVLIRSYKEGPRVWDDFGPFDDGDSGKPMTGSHLVVLDELGTRMTVSDTHYEAVHKLLDMRDAHPMIIVSNHPLDTIASIYDARIASRCVAGTVLELKGPDRRTT